MIPEEVPAELRPKLLAQEIMLPPLLWLVSEAADGVSGQRFDASRWDPNLNPSETASKACDSAGWGAAETALGTGERPLSGNLRKGGLARLAGTTLRRNIVLGQDEAP